MIDKRIIEGIVEEFLNASSNYLVAVEVNSDNAIVVEIDNDKAVSIDDCVALSSYIESKLDRDEEDYSLEVSSSGLGQAFKMQRQYRKNIGNEVEVLARSGIKYKGTLKVVEEKTFVLTIQKQIKPEGAKRKVTVEEDLTFLYDDVKYVKYSF